MTQSANRSILIVEDEPLVAMDVQVLLANFGYHDVAVCNSIETAFQQMKSKLPDLGLLDLNLGPGRSSVMVAMHLKQRGCPFAFLTSFPDNSLMSSSEFKGVPVFNKPVDPDDLMGWVNARFATLRRSPDPGSDRPDGRTTLHS